MQDFGFFPLHLWGLQGPGLILLNFPHLPNFPLNLPLTLRNAPEDLSLVMALL
jgi:hypothetical protein